MKIKFWKKDEEKVVPQEVEVVQQPAIEIAEPPKPEPSVEELIEADVSELKAQVAKGRYFSPGYSYGFLFGSGAGLQIFARELAKIYIKYGKEDVAKKIEAYAQKKYLKEEEEFKPIKYLIRNSSFKEEAEKIIAKVRDLESKIEEVAKNRDEEIHQLKSKYGFHGFVCKDSKYSKAFEAFPKIIDKSSYGSVEHPKSDYFYHDHLKLEIKGGSEIASALSAESIYPLVQGIVRRYDPEIGKLCEQRAVGEKQLSDSGYIEILGKVYDERCRELKKDEYKIVVVMAKRLKQEIEAKEAKEKK
jgi:hypothetical protein